MRCSLNFENHNPMLLYSTSSLQFFVTKLNYYLRLGCRQEQYILIVSHFICWFQPVFIMHSYLCYQNESWDNLSFVCQYKVEVPERQDPMLVLKFIWMEKNIGIALDQMVPGFGSIPLSPYYFWPRKDAWEELRAKLEEKEWISQKQMIILLNIICFSFYCCFIQPLFLKFSSKALFSDLIQGLRVTL